MRPPKYPLEPLAELRHRNVDQAVRALAEATRARDTAERKVLASERDRQAHGAAAESVRRVEAQALAEGGLRAADLARAAAWEARIATEREAMTSAVGRARDEEADARAGEVRALDAVASRNAEAKVVAKDRARWDGAQRKRAEGREEEAACEAWRPAKS
ncbi:MAG TPA: hypothetical protein VN894_00640 [Polyangiaceae bacterium]|nr:hypothetical protein [Polyangiaceae bacterium]